MRFFDMLCSRYNDGLRLVDNFILCGSLCRFIDSFFDFVNESQAWEFWIHKETGMNWNDFKLSVIPQNVDVIDLARSSDSIEQCLAKGGMWSNGIV